MNGKEICKELKAIRRQIAAENGIELEMPECGYRGSCNGTCPRCDMEARVLENELASRLSLGKLATVAGIALTLSAGAASAATAEPLPNDMPGCGLTASPNAGFADAHRNKKDANYALRFVVRDDVELRPYVWVTVKKEGQEVAKAQTDHNGEVLITGLRDEPYDVEFSAPGYVTYYRKGCAPQRYRNKKKDIEIVPIMVKIDILIQGIPADPKAEPDGPNQETGTEGVKVIAR